MPPANTDTDPFFILLTDALCAGPGSQQWHDAIASLRNEGLEAADEHRLLIEVRENLQAGREYRSVRAGPGFTRKVMAEIENQGAAGKRKGVPTATLIALLCGLLILGAVGFVFWRMTTVTSTTQEMVDALYGHSQGFVDSVASASFAGAMPDGWHTIGSLKLDAADGLRPMSDADKDSKNLGGGIVLSNPIAAGDEFAVDITLRTPTPTAAVLLETFVTTDGNFSPDKGTSSRDLVWQLRDKSQNVLINGSGVIGDAPPAYRAGDTIRLIVGKEVAIIEAIPAAGGKPQRLWAGRHELAAGARYVGVRFLETGAAEKGDVRVQQVKISRAPAG